MPAQTAKSPEPAATVQHASFFRQSGWMMISAVMGGALMFVVQILSKHFLADEEYSAFAALIQVTNWIQIPALGLQMVFAQQTAAAVTELQHKQLVGTMKALTRWTFYLWLGVVVLAGIFNHQWVAALKLSNPISLWLTVAVGLIMLWQPIYQGLLQGRQNFLWYGWSAIMNGAGRVVLGGLIVILLHGQAAGLMAGVLLGLIAALGATTWHNRDLWREPAAAFDVGHWLKRVVPLTMGFGVSQFLFSADAIVVQDYFPKGTTADYFFGATLCRAIVLFTAPLASVMFPKLVHSRTSSQKTNLMGVTLLGTGGLSGLAVLGLALVAPFIMKHFSKGDYQTIVALIPLFGGAMVFLGMGNVLMNNLMAHSQFKVVPALLILAVAYWFALQHFHDSFKMVIQTFCVFTIIYLAICAFFTWVVEKPASSA